MGGATGNTASAALIPLTPWPTTVQSQPVNPATQAPARSEAHPEKKGESFSETLSRSLRPTAEKAAPAAAKTAATKPSRRAVDADEADPADLVNALLLTLIPAEISVIAAPAPKEIPVSTGAAAAAPMTDPVVAVLAAPLSAAETVPTAALAAADTAIAAMQGKLEPDPLTAQPPALARLVAASKQDSPQVRPPARPESSNPNSADTSSAQLPVTGNSSLAATSQGADASGQASPADTRESDPRQPLRSEGADGTFFAGVISSPNNRPAAQSPPTIGANFEVVTNMGGESAAAASINAAVLAPPIDPSTTSSGLVLAAAGAAPGLAHLATPDVQTTLRAPVLSPEVGSSEWGKALGQQMIHLGTAGQQTAELQLNPPGLGPLKVTLSLNDQQIQAIFVSAHPSVRAAVEAALPQLRSTLADNGISLGNTSVNAESQPQTAFDDRQNRSSAPSAYQSDRLTEPVATTPNPVTQGARQRHGVTVDTYA